MIDEWVGYRGDDRKSYDTCSWMQGYYELYACRKARGKNAVDAGS